METKERIVKDRQGITLIALIITIIVLLILAGVAVNTLMGDNGIIKNTISVVEKNNIATWKEKIEMSILGQISSGEKEITVDKIIDKLIEKGITTEENSNRETGQVKTEDGYIYEIKQDEKGNWEVTYIGKGELAKTQLSIAITKDVSVLTNKITLTITAKADSGIKSYTTPEGETKTYSSGEKEISEEYEVTANGTYTFTVENNRGKTESKEIIIENILEGTIGMEANTIEWTAEDVIVTVVWPAGSEQGIKEIKIGEGEWAQYTGEESTVAVEENCTVEARVRSSVGDIVSSSITITNIDKTAPTVTANQSSVTITEGDSNAVSDYFTVSANGNASITTTYSVENTNTLSAGTHTITCTVTKANGLSATASITVIVNTAKPEYTKESYTTPGTYTFTVPEGVTTLKITVAGAGGGGGSAAGIFNSKTGASGGSGALITQSIDVTPLQSYSIVVGAGGAGALAPSISGSNGHVVNQSIDSSQCFGGTGGSSSFGSITALGGTGGGCAYYYLDADGYGHQRNGTVATSYGNGGSGGTGTSRGSDAGAGSNGWVYVEYRWRYIS